MAVRLLHWLDESITRKIGSLSAVLLTFILALVLYSIIQLSEISKEIRELAQIDVPITEIAAEIEVLQLEQHIFMERLHYELKIAENRDFELQQVMQKKFNDISHNLKEQVHELIDIIKVGLEQGKIVKQKQAHLALIASFQQFETARDVFHSNAREMLFKSAEDVSDEDWLLLENQADALDQQSIDILRNVEAITSDIASQAEEHETRFFYVNTGLGISAFFIGINVTLLIVVSFRRRMRQINSQIDRLHKSITGQEEVIKTSELSPQGRDELAKLAKDINRVMSRYSEAVEHREGIEEALIQQATVDSLTGAYNRYKWDEEAKLHLTRVQKGSVSSLILLDIDNFKKINDKHGHNTGDRVLQAMVKDIKACLRQSDMVFRMGGEEFAVLLSSCDLHQSRQIAEKVRTSLEQAAHSDIPAFTASFGVTEIRAEDSIESLLERVDIGLYQAKSQGKNQVCFTE